MKDQLEQADQQLKTLRRENSDLRSSATVRLNHTNSLSSPHGRQIANLGHTHFLPCYNNIGKVSHALS